MDRDAVDTMGRLSWPIPKPFKTSFNLAVERLMDLGHEIEGHGTDRYRVDGESRTRAQVMELAARKLVLSYPPERTWIVSADPADLL